MLSFPRDPWRATIAWPPVRFRAAKSWIAKVPFVPCRVAAQRVAPRANATRGAISSEEDRMNGGLRRFASQAWARSWRGSRRAAQPPGNALWRLRVLDRKDLSRRDERCYRRMQRRHDLIQ